VIELTDEMRRLVKARMGVPDGVELDPWMEAAIGDVLAVVERDRGPRRGDEVEAWIKRYRDTHGDPADGYQSAWYALDDLLDDYRDHADTGTPLGREVVGPHEEQS
jgi:hypothetical protein